MGTSRHADEVTRGLLDWVRRHDSGGRVDVQTLGRESEEDGIDIRLLDVAPRLEPRVRGRIDRTLALDYLVTVRFADPIAEHRRVAELAFAAMANPFYEIVADRPPAQACLALGLKPSAGLVLRAQARLSEDQPRAPLVREPAITRIVPLAFVEGTVVGPGNVPIAGALVTVDGSDRAATTGADGRFRFATPADTAVRGTVRARSTEMPIVAEPGRPAIIPLPLET